MAGGWDTDDAYMYVYSALVYVTLQRWNIVTTGVSFQIEIIINVLVRFFRFIWIIPRLWVYNQYNFFIK